MRKPVPPAPTYAPPENRVPGSTAESYPGPGIFPGDRADGKEPSGNATPHSSQVRIAPAPLLPLRVCPWPEPGSGLPVSRAYLVQIPRRPRRHHQGRPRLACANQPDGCDPAPVGRSAGGGTAETLATRARPADSRAANPSRQARLAPEQPHGLGESRPCHAPTNPPVRRSVSVKRVLQSAGLITLSLRVRPRRPSRRASPNRQRSAAAPTTARSRRRRPCRAACSRACP
jgi:hypothetical protein